MARRRAPGGATLLGTRYLRPVTPVDREEAIALADELVYGVSPGILQRAAAIRDQRWGNIITYSPKVFIPLTVLCRDVCHYCTFAKPPAPGQRAFMLIDEVVALAKQGAEAGCREALFTLGDKPELRYRQAKEELHAIGYDTTLQYLRAAAQAVLNETPLIPHLNPGIMSALEIEDLREVSASMGIMLESISTRLLSKGHAHHGSPDKDPALRLSTIAEAGRHNIPFTTGILIGIGETWEERIDSLLAIEKLHRSHGHIQEVIVQNFRAKPDTLMRDHTEPPLDDMVSTIALARLILSPEISVQAPPNLADGDESLAQYIDAGLNDWGGVSPVTIDHVNPEAPWPHLEHLRDVTEASGYMLVPRLTVYPRYALDPDWVDRTVRAKVLAASDSEGFARDDSWHPGEPIDPPRVFESPTFWSKSVAVPMRESFVLTLDRAMSRQTLDEDDITLLFSARGPEQEALFESADQLRREISGDVVTYVVNRNINYTNMCYFKCGFCAFSKGPKSLNLRGDPYLLEFDEIAARTVEAREHGATEVCLQGGIHPSFTGDYYVKVLDAIKTAVPDIHVHAFSPLEVWQGAETKGVSLRDFLMELKDHGLSTLPGTAAEILDDDVRAIICPDKINTEQWSTVARTAHSLDLKMTTTIMFGHADSLRSWARHLIVLRDIQQDTGGFTEFVPLPFVHMAAPIFLRGRARRGPTFDESLKMHAVARLALHPWITNIQTSWVKMGAEGAKMALQAGANDLGGTLMNETISRAAGASHGQEMPPDKMQAIAAAAGRPSAQRTTLYAELPSSQLGS